MTAVVFTYFLDLSRPEKYKEKFHKFSWTFPDRGNPGQCRGLQTLKQICEVLKYGEQETYCKIL